LAIPRKIKDIKSIFGNLALTSHYEVRFGGLSGDLRDYLYRRGVDPLFINQTVGLLCSSASIPGSTFATADVSGNFTGVTEKFAHTRVFTQIDLEFYVDSQYKTMKFLEHWMEFISSGSNLNPSETEYFFRMRYPNTYKCDYTKIFKFDRDYRNEIEYNFFGMFPLSLNSSYVSYEGSQILKATASFNYDRYVAGKNFSFNIFSGNSNNRNPGENAPIVRKPPIVYRTGQSLGNESGVRPTTRTPGNVNPTIVK
jgi:hypothetical protein